MNYVNQNWFNRPPGFYPDDLSELRVCHMVPWTISHSQTSPPVTDNFHEPIFAEVPITNDMEPAEMRVLLEQHLPGVTIVNDEESAVSVLNILMSLKNRYGSTGVGVMCLY